MGGLIKSINNNINLCNLSFSEIQIFANHSFFDITGEKDRKSQINITNITLKNIIWYKINDFQGFLKIQRQTSKIFLKSLYFLSLTSEISMFF